MLKERVEFLVVNRSSRKTRDNGSECRDGVSLQCIANPNRIDFFEPLSTRQRHACRLRNCGRTAHVMTPVGIVNDNDAILTS